MQVVRRFDKTHRRLGLSRATSRGSPQVLVRSRLRRASLLRPALESLAQKILTAAGEPGAELSLDLVGDRRMRRLNRQYRGRNHPTDVLAFPMREALTSITRHPSIVRPRGSRRAGSGPNSTAFDALRPRACRGELVAGRAVSSLRPRSGSTPSEVEGSRGASPVTPEVLGDVVISFHTAARHAAADGHSVEHELAKLVIHGVLHLVGYDHERSEREARRMQRKERAILRSLMPIPKLIANRK